MKFLTLTCALIFGSFAAASFAAKPGPKRKCAIQLRLASGMDETAIQAWYQKQFQRDVARTQKAKSLDQLPEFYRRWLNQQQLPQLESDVVSLTPRVAELQAEALKLFHQLKELNEQRAAQAKPAWNVITHEGESVPVRSNHRLVIWGNRVSALETEYEIVSGQYLELRKELEGKQAAIVSLKVSLGLLPPPTQVLPVRSTSAEVIEFDTAVHLENARDELATLQRRSPATLSSDERERMSELSYEILAAETYLMIDSEPDQAG